MICDWGIGDLQLGFAICNQLFAIHYDYNWLQFVIVNFGFSIYDWQFEIEDLQSAFDNELFAIGDWEWIVLGLVIFNLLLIINLCDWQFVVANLWFATNYDLQLSNSQFENCNKWYYSAFAFFSLKYEVCLWLLWIPSSHARPGNITK